MVFSVVGGQDVLQNVSEVDTKTRRLVQYKRFIFRCLTSLPSAGLNGLKRSSQGEKRGRGIAREDLSSDIYLVTSFRFLPYGVVKERLLDRVFGARGGGEGSGR